jgi:hypothetical protein
MDQPLRIAASSSVSTGSCMHWQSLNPLADATLDCDASAWVCLYAPVLAGCLVMSMLAAQVTGQQ